PYTTLFRSAPVLSVRDPRVECIHFPKQGVGLVVARNRHCRTDCASPHLSRWRGWHAIPATALVGYPGTYWVGLFVYVYPLPAMSRKPVCVARYGGSEYPGVCSWPLFGLRRQRVAELDALAGWQRYAYRYRPLRRHFDNHLFRSEAPAPVDATSQRSVGIRCNTLPGRMDPSSLLSHREDRSDAFVGIVLFRNCHHCIHLPVLAHRSERHYPLGPVASARGIKSTAHVHYSFHHVGDLPRISLLSPPRRIADGCNRRHLLHPVCSGRSMDREVAEPNPHPAATVVAIGHPC